jgi:hypothetical protein
MYDIKDIFNKYIKPIPNPNALSFAMVGISTLMLVYFVAYKEDSPNEDKDESPSTSDESPSTSDESPSTNRESQLREYEEQTTRGGTKRHHQKNKKTKRRKL